MQFVSLAFRNARLSGASRKASNDFEDARIYQPLYELAGNDLDQSVNMETILSELLNGCVSNVKKLCGTVGTGKTYLYCYDRLSLGVFQIMKALNFDVDGFIDDNIEYLIPKSEIKTRPISPNTLDGKLPQDSTFIVCHDNHGVYLEKKKQFKEFEEDGLRIVKFTTEDFVAGLRFENLFKQNF